MALNGFASGAVVAAPLAAVLTWLAVTWQQHVDLRVGRDTVQVGTAGTTAGADVSGSGSARPR